MSVVHMLDTLTEWARQNICEQIKLKVPPENTAPDDSGYAYNLATPAAFAMYVPTSDKLSPGIHAPFPSLCVRFVTGQDVPAEGSGSVEVQLCFSAWNPGTHGEDVFLPNGDGTMHRWTGEDADAYFKRNGDGWRDAWNFVDIALRAVESVTNIGGYAIDRAKSVKFGPLTEQEAIPDFYPMWFAWVSFTVNYPLRRNIQGIQEFL
ncbi:hypothetical protein [Acidaminococcus intestini]|uniref:hypothetical protein n=1 Tax=Acidaminococcus intestini TaxID=187327 RepID=UPI0027B9F675|nr:hypothetical protein [Acidaminococcus intestini]